MYRCPKGYSYWKVSRRCEKTEKLGNCKLARDGLYNRIPVEWINLGKSRSLKFQKNKNLVQNFQYLRKCTDYLIN